jgi:hypothetical protein
MSDFLDDVREFAAYANASATTVATVGMAAITSSSGGAASSADAADGVWLQRLTTGVSGTIATFATPATVRPDHVAECVVGFKTGASVADVRIWVGLLSGDPTASATPDLEAAALRYDTVADGTAFFRFYSEFTGNGGSPEVTATTLAVAADTAYAVKFAVSTTAVSVYTWDALNEEWDLLATHASILPAATTALTLRANLTTLAAAAKGLRFGYFKIRLLK